MTENTQQTSLRIYSGTVFGMHGQCIEVEVDASNGIHDFTIVGLPDKSVQESSDRIGSAIKNCGLTPPHHTTKRIVVNLAPAHIKKEGPAFDLPIALGYLAVTKQIPTPPPNALFVGEIALNGALRPISGALSIAIMARQSGFERIFIPSENAAEVSLVRDIEIMPVDNLVQIIAHLAGSARILPYLSNIDSDRSSYSVGKSQYDLSYIRGNESAKRALVLAAAGGHNILFHGPPGSGKSMLAHTMQTILPPLAYDEALEVAQLYSISGLSHTRPSFFDRPFRSPHHTASTVAIIGGGSKPKPGEISLAHKGVLFLDELPEYQRQVIEAMRQPLENGMVAVARAAQSVSFPADFQLVAAMNPCPCGMHKSPAGQCTCSIAAIMGYQRKISGPLLDRIDLHVQVPYEAISLETLHGSGSGMTSFAAAQTILSARIVQGERLKNEGVAVNARLASSSMDRLCPCDREAIALLETVLQKQIISRRGYYKILKVARTIADLDHSDVIKREHIAEAVSYRSGI